MMIILKAASILIEMKKSKPDESTSTELSKLLAMDSSDTNHEEEKSQENDQVIAFGPNTEFLRKLESGELTVETLSLPQLGHGIDEIPLPELPPIPSIRGRIGKCSCPFEKQLTTTDLVQGQARFAMCKEPVEKSLKPLLREGENLKEGITVKVYDKKGRGFSMTFKFWGERKMHVLTMGWNKFWENNELKACEDWVTVWMFRDNTNEGLCFVVIPRRFPIYKLIGKNGNGSSSEERKKKKKSTR